MSVISGTKEWAVANVNCVDGCSHNCRYCYARYMQCDRLKRIKVEDWPNERIRQKDVDAPHKKLYDGRVMLPTTHDITPTNVSACLVVLRKLLVAGNRVLIVSKPHESVVWFLCKELLEWRSQILFRFTIGAMYDSILEYWEPGAPRYLERLNALMCAYDKAYATSVSIEPMLDASNVLWLVKNLKPYVSDTIWIGKMNKPEQRVKAKTWEDRERLRLIIEGQTDEKIKAIYESLKGEPKVRWKESIKSVVGLPLATEAGTDL